MHSTVYFGQYYTVVFNCSRQAIEQLPTQPQASAVRWAINWTMVTHQRTLLVSMHIFSLTLAHLTGLSKAFHRTGEGSWITQLDRVSLLFLQHRGHPKPRSFSRLLVILSSKLTILCLQRTKPMILQLFQSLYTYLHQLYKTISDFLDFYNTWNVYQGTNTYHWHL